MRNSNELNSITNGELEFNNRPFVKHRTDNRGDRDDYGSTGGRNQYRKNFGGRSNQQQQQQQQPGNRDIRDSGSRDGSRNRNQQGPGGGRDNRNNNNRNFKKRY